MSDNRTPDHKHVSNWNHHYGPCRSFVQCPLRGRYGLVPCCRCGYQEANHRAR